MIQKSTCLISLIIMIAVCLFLCPKSNASPEITKQEFPFCIEYSVEGQIFKLEDTVVCEFDGFSPNSGHKSPDIIRSWSEKFKSTDNSYSDVLIVEEYNKKSILKNRTNLCSFVYLSVGHAEYYMGDKYKEIEAPCFYYYESFERLNGYVSGEYTVLSEEQLKDFFDIEIISVSFKPPIENSFDLP